MLALTVLALAGSGGARATASTPSTHQRPALAPVSLSIPAASLVATSSVVWKDGRAWFAVAVDRQLRIYRWQRNQWTLDGAVGLPDGMPVPGAVGGELRSTSITGADTPDFTSHAWGADTAWFALAARIRGHWRIVPFDDQFGPHHAYTFAYGAEHHLIHGGFDACGCASGPTTDQWYRFAHDIFVATSSPAQEPVCSAKALTAANHWPPLPYDPLVRDVAKPFQVVRFACADGWALATDGHKVSVYEQHGPRLNDPVGHDWLRVGVGAPHLVGTRTDFAMPRSLLNRLGTKIGMRLPPAAPEPTSPAPPQRKPWQRATINVRIQPGDTYSATNLFDGRPRVLTVTIGSGTSSKSVWRFHWRNDRWIRS